MTSPPVRDAGALPIAIGFREFVALMAALMAINALGIDTMLPALPAIGRSIGIVGENQRQWIIASYMLGFGLTQLVYGPLADRFGRKPIVVICLILYAMTCMVASLATSFSMMIAARVLQGMAAAASRVLVVSIVRDCYSGRQMARVMSLSFVVFLAAPILAPSLGQLIMLVAPWNAIFHTLAGFASCVCLWVIVRLPETLHPSYRRKIEVHTLWSAAKSVMNDRYSLGYTLALTAMFGSMMGYINSSQQIFSEALGAARYFALIFAFAAAAMGVASFLNSQIVERFGSRLVSHTALLGFIAVAALHVMWSLLIGDTVLSFATFQFFILFFFGFTGSNFGAMAMESMGEIAGTASSLQGTISTLGAAIIGIEIGQLYNGTALPMVLGTLICGVATLLIVLVTESGQLFHSRNAA